MNESPMASRCLSDGVGCFRTGCAWPEQPCIEDRPGTGAREAEGSGLLSRPASNGRAGSNPAPSARRWPRYLRTRQSHCLYTKNWHVYVFPWAKAYDQKRNLGFTIKHRRRDTTWRHMTARTMFYSSNRGDGRILHSELVTHVSTDWGHGRVPYSKRYVRFKVCL